jgi:class 3 adenylate cyclase
LLLEFSGVVGAVRCVVEVRTAMALRNADLPQDRHIEFRISVNLGDIVIDGDDILGDGVNVAARLQESAQPDGICVSSHVHDDVRTGYTLGLRRLKSVPR